MIWNVHYQVDGQDKYIKIHACQLHDALMSAHSILSSMYQGKNYFIIGAS